MSAADEEPDVAFDTTCRDHVPATVTAMSDTYLACPECPHEEWVSPEDPDSSLSEIGNHLRFQHPAVDHDAPEVWQRVREVRHA